MCGENYAWRSKTVKSSHRLSSFWSNVRIPAMFRRPLAVLLPAVAALSSLGATIEVYSQSGCADCEWVRESFLPEAEARFGTEASAYDDDGNMTGAIRGLTPQSPRGTNGATGFHSIQSAAMVDSIHRAILDRDVDAVEISLQHGLDPNGVYRYDYLGLHTYRNPLEFAIEDQCSNIVAVLLEYGGKPTAKTILDERRAWRAIDAAYECFIRNGTGYPLSSFLDMPFSDRPDERSNEIESRYLLETVLATSFPVLKAEPMHLFVDDDYRGTFLAGRNRTFQTKETEDFDPIFWQQWISGTITNYMYPVSCWTQYEGPKFKQVDAVRHGIADFYETPCYSLSRKVCGVQDFEGFLLSIHFNEKEPDREFLVNVDKIWTDSQSLYLQSDWCVFVKTNNWWIHVRR